MAVLIRTVHLKEIAQALRDPARPLYIIAAGLLVFPNLFLQWYRWHFLLRLINPAVTALESAGSLFGGMVAGFVTPGRIGEVSRTLFIEHEDRLQAFGMIMLDKIYAFCPVFIGGAWGIMLLLGYLFRYATFLVFPLIFISVLVSFLFVYIALHPSLIRTFLYNLSILLPIRDKVKRLIGCVDRFKTRQARTLFFLSILLYGTYIFQFCLLAQAFQAIPWTTALTATTSTILVKTLLPISLGDLGIREGASMYFFMKFQVLKVTAFNSSLLLFVINVLFPTFIGLLFIPKMSWKNKEKSR